MKIQKEAQDLDRREATLKAKETKQVQHELKAAILQIDAVVKDFERQLNLGESDQFNLLIRKSEAAIASIVEAHRPTEEYLSSEREDISYIPQIGEQVHVQGLGNKLATVVEAPADDGMVLVQYGKIKVRVQKSNIRPISSNKRNTTSVSLPKRLVSLKNAPAELLCSVLVFIFCNIQSYSSNKRNYITNLSPKRVRYFFWQSDLVLE